MRQLYGFTAASIRCGPVIDNFSLKKTFVIIKDLGLLCPYNAACRAPSETPDKYLILEKQHALSTTRYLGLGPALRP